MGMLAVAIPLLLTRQLDVEADGSSLGLGGAFIGGFHDARPRR